MIQISDVLDHVIIKEKNYADQLDNELKRSGFDMRKRYLEYKYAVTETDNIYTYEYTIEDLQDYTDNKYKLAMMIRKDTGPGAIEQFLTEDQKKDLVAKKRRQIARDYTELNEYYRTILGLPPLKKITYTEPATRKTKYRLEEDESYFYYIQDTILGTNKEKPVHKWTRLERESLKNYKFKESDLRKFPYLKHIGKNVDIISLRDADVFEIVWTDIHRSISSTSSLLPFLDEYRIVRNHYIKNHYSFYDSSQNNYYEKIQLITLFLATIQNINAKEMNNIGDRELELEDIYNIFASFGLPRYKFSLKYLKILASRLSMLVYNKGTNSNLLALSDLFHDIKIFKYFLIKTVNEENEYSDSNYEKYDLKYVKTPLDADEPYDYLNDERNIYDFKTITQLDNRWGFDQNIYYPPADEEGNIPDPILDPKLEYQLKDTEFSWTPSKYLGLDSVINLGWMSMKVASFYRWIIENKHITERYELYFEYVDVKTNLFEMLLYLQCLMFYKYQREPSVPDTLDTYFKVYTIAEKIDVNEVLKVLAKVYPDLITFNTKDGVLYNNIERISPSVKSNKDTPFSVNDLSYIMNRYSERKELKSFGVLDNRLAIDDNIDQVLDTYYHKDNSVPTEDDENIFEKVKEEREELLRRGIDTTDVTEEGTIASNLITFLAKQSDDNFSADIHNTYSKFEINVDAIRFLTKVRNELTDYNDFELIDTVLRSLTEGEKVMKQFTKDNGNKYTNLVEYLVSLDPVKNIVFAQRIEELARDKDRHKDNFDNEIIEVISLLRSKPFYNDQVHHHTEDALEYAQRIYTDNEAMKYLEAMVDFFKSYTQDIVSKGSEYILDNGKNILKVIEHVNIDAKMMDYDVGTAFIAYSMLPNEFLTKIIDRVTPEDTIFISERLEKYIEEFDKYYEIASSGIYLT